MRRSRLRDWGATREELAASHAGDELLSGPVSTTTFGVTVNAPAAELWSWLVQIGQGRGGMYSYEWLENLFGWTSTTQRRSAPGGSAWRSATRCAWCHAASSGCPTATRFGWRCVDPPHALVLRQQPPEHPWNATWAFLIEPRGNGRCRLLARSRSARVPGLGGAGARVAEELMRPVMLLMTRKMLLGIKDRAERHAPPASRPGGDGVDLYWLPLGAGGRFVRSNGRLYEALAARLQHRDRSDLYHSALEVHVGGDRYVIEQAPVWNMKDPDRGVVCEGAGRRAMAGTLQAVPLRGPPLAQRHHPRPWRGGRQPAARELRPRPRPAATRSRPPLPDGHVGARRAADGRDVELQLAHRLAAGTQRTRQRRHLPARTRPRPRLARRAQRRRS